MKIATLALAMGLLMASPANALPVSQPNGLLDRLQRYLSVDTQSLTSSKTRPSTPKQAELAKLLVTDLKGLGVEARVDAVGNVFATLPGNVASAPTIAFLAHLDTLNKPGKPKVIRAYDGTDITLDQGSLKTRENPDLLNCIGADLVVADGKSPIGLDGKAGLAICLGTVETLKRHPEYKHGALKFVFLADAARGLYRVDAKAIGADAAYLVDGGPVGELNTESFSASTVVVTVFGRDIAPGYAKGRLINALPIAARFLAQIPSEVLPERSDRRQGFVFPYDLRGGASKATLTLLVRDFELSELAKKEAQLRAIAADLQAKYPQAKITLEVKPSTRNIKEFLGREPRLLDHLLAACKKIEIPTTQLAVRGGSDCAEFAQRGLVTMPLFTGGHRLNFPNEWISLSSMNRTVETLVELAQCWAKGEQ